MVVESEDSDVDISRRVRSERRRAEDFDDLQHELSGQETGRQQRFLPDTARSRAEKQRRRERTDRLLTELDSWLRDPIYRAQYEGFGDFLNEAENATETALSKAVAALGEARDRLQSVLDKANVLPGGTKVFRAADGRIMDENGNVVSAEDAAGIVWRDGAATYEEYLAAKRRAEDARNLVDDIRSFQTDVLGTARNRWEDTDDPITPEEMEEWRRRIEAEMPAIGQPRAEAAISQEPAGKQNPLKVGKPIL